MGDKYSEQDLKTAKAVGKLEGTVDSLRETVEGGFVGIHQRLDKITEITNTHNHQIQYNANSISNHSKHHNNFEKNIQRKVGFWGLISSIVGAFMAGVVAVIAFFKRL